MPNTSYQTASAVGVGVVGGDRRHLARQGAAEHADLGAELLGDEFELGDRLFRVVHRDDRGRRHPVAEILEIVGRDDVVGADHRAPRRVVLDARQAQPGGRIDDREIGADLVQPLIEQMRHHRGGAVERVAGLAGPEARHRDAAGAGAPRRQHQRSRGSPPSTSRNPSAAMSPPTLRICSANTGSYSTQWPSPSTIGWLSLARISAGLWWA